MDVGPSAYLPRMPTLQVIEVPNSTALPTGLTLWRRHSLLFKPLSCIFLTASEALLFVHNLHDARQDFSFYTFPAASPSNGLNSR